MQHYSSSASEPVATPSYSIASPIADIPLGEWGSGRGLFPHELLKRLSECLVHVERRFIGHLRIDKRCIQCVGGVVSLLAQVTAHLADLVSVKVDGNDSLYIAAIGDLIAFIVEAITSTTVGNKRFGAAKIGHAAE